MRALQDVDNLIGRVVDGRYRVTERIGTGAMAAIYRAEQDREPKDVALKIIRPEIVQNRTVSARFHREAKAASKLRHPGIVGIVGWGFEGDIPYIAMELIEGEDLFEVLEREGPLPQAWSVLTAMRICDALAVAHAEGVVHRDLKPENVMVIPPVDGGEHGVKVLDFGIAKLVGPVGYSDETVPQVLTKVGSAVGTPSHMAPEQARGDQVDGRSDIYALGVVLYEMVTGHLPFEGNNPLLVAIQQVRDEPPPPSRWLPDIHPKLEQLILRMLAKSPDERPQTADLLGRQLAVVFDELVDEHAHRTRATGEAPHSSSGEHLTGRQPSVAPPPADDDRDLDGAPTAITAVTRMTDVSDDDSLDTFTAETFTEAETDPTTLKRDVAKVRKALELHLALRDAKPFSNDSGDDVTIKEIDRGFEIEDEPTTLDDRTDKIRTERIPRAALRAGAAAAANSGRRARRTLKGPPRIIPEHDDDDGEGAPTRERHDSEAPIATVVADPKPLVEMARELSRRASEISTVEEVRSPLVDKSIGAVPAIPPARAPLDSEAPIATVVADPKPLVEMARELSRRTAAEREEAARAPLDSEAPIATVVSDAAPLVDAARQYEALRAGGGLRPTAEIPGVPGTMRSGSAPPPGLSPASQGIPPTEPSGGFGARPGSGAPPARTLVSAGADPHDTSPRPPPFEAAPGRPIFDTHTGPLPGHEPIIPPGMVRHDIGDMIAQHVPVSHPIPLQPPPGPRALPPSEWPVPSAGRNYQGELEEMLKEMPKGRPIVGTIVVIALVALAVCALAWVLFIY